MRGEISIELLVKVIIVAAVVGIILFLIIASMRGSGFAIVDFLKGLLPG